MRPLFLALFVIAGAAPFAGCAHPPGPAPENVAPAANPAAPVVGPRRATGWYDLTTTLPVTRRASPPTGRSRHAAATLRLEYQLLAAPDATAASSTQLAAAVSIPGYTRAPRGRAAQAAAWWPLPGDSVVVHFRTPRADGVMELRGTEGRGYT
ncbi:MAG: hypothetical protein B7Z72_10885, partial [Gemmatimonadetes bacterium 21-71-4]